VLSDSYVLRNEEHDIDWTRREMIVLKSNQVAMYILICLQRIDEEKMKTLTFQWVESHYNLKKKVLEVICCLNFESQLLKVKITTSCNEMTLITSFKRYIMNQRSDDSLKSREFLSDLTMTTYRLRLACVYRRSRQSDWRTFITWSNLSFKMNLNQCFVQLIQYESNTWRLICDRWDDAVLTISSWSSINVAWDNRICDLNIQRKDIILQLIVLITWCRL